MNAVAMVSGVSTSNCTLHIAINHMITVLEQQSLMNSDNVIRHMRTCHSSTVIT